jgi:hypothetical protein
MICFYDGSNSLTVFEASSATTVVAAFATMFSTTQDTANVSNPLTFPSTGVTIQSVAATPGPPNLYVAVKDGATVTHGDTPVPIPDNYVTSTGDEDIDVSFSTAPTAVGFDFFTNGFHPLIVSVFDPSTTLLATYNLLPGKPASLGFLGIISDVTIGTVNWKSTNGSTKNTGIANIRAGNKL